MEIQEYLSKLNIESQLILQKTVLQKDKIGMMHHLSSCLFDLSNCIPDPQGKEMLETVCAQLESATFTLTLGLYRQAFSSLRLALEMGLAAIYFSAHRVELNEWIDGRIDIKWSRLVDEENGVLSQRFTKAFCKDLTDDVKSYRIKSISVYRQLSEYVHGNNETWEFSSIKLSYKDELIEKYFESYKDATSVIIFATICRYISIINSVDKESLDFIPHEFHHIAAIRTMFGHS
ncbi:hypothetical protein CJF24_14940 [Aeromonas veronii]|uniref:Uncharacterized protein n=1 Tax=Aeromonas veronii TaxID=654 RepID=A0ABY3MJC8_AERVE|nr:hypothetical protein [Aeromonas veronii]RDU81788.1 hypothetical protein CGZ76_17655 [Aeromonas veronii]TEY48027.1 hypothetical protein CIG14_16750 [Aeromonas veronii]TEY74799.1 hypothetical protein CIG16_17580 [Aeromonas veronii]TYD43017.1 hypothetical protein CJF24_14940 [Aeromonas veronii]